MSAWLIGNTAPTWRRENSGEKVLGASLGAGRLHSYQRLHAGTGCDLHWLRSMESGCFSSWRWNKKWFFFLLPTTVVVQLVAKSRWLGYKPSLLGLLLGKQISHAWVGICCFLGKQRVFRCWALIPNKSLTTGLWNKETYKEDQEDYT